MTLAADGTARTHRTTIPEWSVAPGGLVTIGENFNMPVRVISRDHVILQFRNRPEMTSPAVPVLRVEACSRSSLNRSSPQRGARSSDRRKALDQGKDVRCAA